MGPTLVTGSSGRVGSRLMAHLGGRAVPFHLPEHDVLDRGDLEKQLTRCEQAVHLAWDVATETRITGAGDPLNLTMTQNVLEVALEVGVGRVVLASSVHAGAVGAAAPRGLHADEPSSPASAYGESKLVAEAYGRAAAAAGLQVVAIRLGGVAPRRPAHPDERPLWVQRADWFGAFDAVLNSSVRPGHFGAFYVISPGRALRHSLANDYGWRPARLNLRRTLGR